MMSSIESLHMDLFGMLPQSGSSKEQEEEDKMDVINGSEVDVMNGDVDQMMDVIDGDGAGAGSDIAVFNIDEEIARVSSTLKHAASFSGMTQKENEEYEQRLQEEAEEAEEEERRQAEAIEESRKHEQELLDQENAEMEKALQASMNESNARDEDVNLIAARRKVFICHYNYQYYCYYYYYYYYCLLLLFF
jgi:hypothetical protein